MMARRNDTDDADLDASVSPWTDRKFLTAVVVVALIVIAGITIAVSPARESSDGDITGTDPEYSNGSQQSAPSDTELLTAAPDGVEWELVSGVAVPVSMKHGPAVDDGTTATGFSRTPEGALIAAAQIIARSGPNMPEKTWQATITGQYVAGDDREALFEQVDATPDYDYSDSDVASYAGFTYRSFDADTAVIELAMDAGGGAHIAVTVTLVWIEDDWRMQPPQDGIWTSNLRTLNNLTGVIAWGAAA